MNTREDTFMASHFNGTLEELKDRLSSVDGNWTEDSSGKHIFRSADGGIVNWWSSKGTINFQGKEPASKTLETLVFGQGAAAPGIVPSSPADRKDRKIFIVHGHDSTARDQLELALRRLHLDPFVLMNNASQGKTIIEALEGQIGKNFSSAFGIVLMTPDDRGYAINDGQDYEDYRARQNVILETGMLLASLTRQRMALIVKGHLEYPSDLEGIIRLHYNDHIREIVPKLCQNLRAAGFDISSEAMSEASS